jgi:hypothetical protein
MKHTSTIAMKVLKGTAVGIRSTISVSGGGRDSGVSTTHHTFFKLGTMTVMFTSGFPALIGEGDRLAVAGRLKGRMLIAEAYINETARVSGDAGLWSYFVGMLVGLLLGSASLLTGLLGLVPSEFELELFWKIVLVVFGLVFCVLGLYCMSRWLRIRNAVRLLRSC